MKIKEYIRGYFGFKQSDLTFSIDKSLKSINKIKKKKNKSEKDYIDIERLERDIEYLLSELEKVINN